MNKRWSVLVLWSLTAVSGVASAHVAMNTDSEPQIAPQSTPAPSSPAPVTFAAPAPVVQALPEAEPALSDTDTASLDKREVECVAKVVVHEAGNQPHRGQVAVAQVIRARMNSGRFADSACGVVKQRGQFFNVDAYNPPRNNGRWDTAVDIAKRTLSGKGEDVAPGALFFHSAGASMPKRTRVTQIADHTFYR
ncbi:cell wall hydrolase [Sphingomonas lacusdianchii]|uniref:cell wall hydrolase n=1 Tax=Sphingomonas lacusdianchii TaxID=2917992 RepID=UPI001F588239|nr:cell wall hydrolase [Sphingomonas sp. JXJ CY 53]